MKKPALYGHLQQLNQTALDIEFLLISVIQGVALATLVSASSSPLISLQIQTWPYVLAAFLFILIFWSGAIIHAVSFIDWPINLYHSFLYFLASLIEIIAITNLARPLLWFIFLFLFQIIALLLYSYDLYLIKQHKKNFLLTPSGKALYNHIVSEQQKELKVFIPASLIFNAVAVCLIFFYKSIFILKGYHLIFIFLQLLFAVAFLSQEIKSFKRRSQLLSQHIV